MDTQAPQESLERKEGEANIESPKERANAVLREAEEEQDDLFSLINAGRQSVSEVPASNNDDWLTQLSSNASQATEAFGELKQTLDPFAFEAPSGEPSPLGSPMDFSASANPLFAPSTFQPFGEAAPNPFSFPSSGMNFDEDFVIGGTPKNLDAKKWQELKTNDPEKSAKQLQEYLAKQFGDKPCSFDDLEAMETLANGDEATKETILNALAKKIGKEQATRLLEDPSYRQELRTLQETLSQKWNEKGPVLLARSSLDRLVSVKEYFGNNDIKSMVSAFDLAKFEPSLTYGEQSEILDIPADNREVDPLTGAYTNRVGVHFDFHDAEGNKAEMTRTFKLQRTPLEDGGFKDRKTVNHDTFKIPPELQSKGLATKTYAEALVEYDKNGVDAITTWANIDMGGYVWQSYGFGWDADMMAPGEDPAEQEIMMQVNIRNAINGAKIHAVERLQKLGLCDENGTSGNPEIQTLLNRYDELYANPLASTPQDLGKIGSGKGLEHLKFFRAIKPDPETGKRPDHVASIDQEEWYTADQLKEALAKGHFTQDEFNAMQKQGFHIGKMGMAHLDYNWHGAIELKKPSKTREQFEKKIQPSS